MIWTPRIVARVIGIVLLSLGLLCVPLGIGASAKRDTSVFSNFADQGLYMQAALILIVGGVVVALLSLLLPRDD
jgi:hypothetical protein